MIEIRWDAGWKGLINQKQLEEILKVFLKKLLKMNAVFRFTLLMMRKSKN